MSELGSKAGLQQRAARLGLLEHLPEHYASPEMASFPCIVKPTSGCAGRGVRLVQDAVEVVAALEANAADGQPLGPLLLQEWVPGPTEFATSMVLRNGEIYAAATVIYEYDRPDYHWPSCHEVARRFPAAADPRHLRVLRCFLADFSGVCNANYKLNPRHEMRILEFNPRLGGDLGTDLPRERAASMLSVLDALEAGTWTAKPLV